jgi:hypothetical protein
LKLVDLSFIDLSFFLVELDKFVKFYLFFLFDLEFGLEFVLRLNFLAFELGFQVRHFSLVSFLGPVNLDLLVLDHMGMLSGVIVPLL